MQDRVDQADTVLIYAIRRTEGWWRKVGENLGYGRCVITADLNGVGDYDIVKDFNLSYKEKFNSEGRQLQYFSVIEINDIIARCRLLRWLDKGKAIAMIEAMASVFDKILSSEKPAVIVSFPIDRYVSDVLERLAKSRKIPYFELTASLLPDMSMLMYRGELIKFDHEFESPNIDDVINEIANPNFTPSYVQVSKKYTLKRFLKTYCYFKIRGWAFKLISIIKRDPLNLHYMDSQSFLGHKPSLGDAAIIKMIDYNWREKLKDFGKSNRVFLGLQLFPEASIDYWIQDLELIEHEDMLVEVAEVFTKAGFQILVKDHPLQYGFRQINLLERLLSFPNVILIPYEVSGNELLSLVDTNFTCTGTLGLQAALQGLKSVTTKNYYSSEEDFIVFNSRDEISNLPERVMEAKPPVSLKLRRQRIIANLMSGSFTSDFFSFEGYDKNKENETTVDLGVKLGEIIRTLLDKDK